MALPQANDGGRNRRERPRGGPNSHHVSGFVGRTMLLGAVARLHLGAPNTTEVGHAGLTRRGRRPQPAQKPHGSLTTQESILQCWNYGHSLVLVGSKKYCSGTVE